MMQIGPYGWMVLLAASASGCQDVIDLDPIDRRAPIEASVRPKPIAGGTLALTSDGLAVAADPDRDLVHVVDVWARSVRHTLALEPGDEPGRVIQGEGSRVHVVLRGFGGITTVDVEDGTVLARTRVCPEPRGIAFDAGPGLLHVACADGLLVTLAEASHVPVGRQWLGPDLRDVVVVGDEVLVSRFRDASLVDLEGYTVAAPDDAQGEPTVAWRTWADASGDIFMLHQLSATRAVPITPPPEPDGELPYGGSGGFCQPGLVTAALTRTRGSGAFTVPLPEAALTVDAAVSPGGWLALAMPGAAEGTATVGLLELDSDGCRLITRPMEHEVQVTAVAFDAGGVLVMQSREPARLLVLADVPNGALVEIELPGEPRYDTGHEIFHRATESGLSCASCHPEGGDDGHVWTFTELGPRRTQPLDVGLEGTEPFHWDGDMDDLDVLVEDVLAHRMGGMRQSRPRGESFARWLFAQQRPPAGPGVDDPALVAQGEALFTAYDCVRCHTGPVLGGTMTTPIHEVELQVPSLRRVSLHPPFMHDGRAPTLEDATYDMLVATTDTLRPASDHVAALAAYLRTL